MSYMSLRRFCEIVGRPVRESDLACPRCGAEKSIEIESTEPGCAPSVCEVCGCGWNELQEAAQAGEGERDA